MDVVSQANVRPPMGWRARWSRSLASIRNKNARGWYGGASWGVAFQIPTFIALWTMNTSVVERSFTSVCLLIFYTAFFFAPPMLWWETLRVRMLSIVVLLVAACLFFPLLGSTAFWLWVLVAVDAAVVFEEWIIVASWTAFFVVVPLLYGLATGWNDAAPYSSIVTFAVVSMLFGLNRQIRTVRELRLAQDQVARLAVVEERARFSRDMHDVVGHALTVVTVKSELARRLVSIDPDRAREEIADIERLSRSALADLRAAVTGYREMSFSTELAAAQATLAAANIEAHLPRNGEVVNPEFSTLFGWVLREGVTNVIRHSDAENCWVEVTATSLSISDDGRGMALPVGSVTDGAPVAPTGGNGLDGLQARAKAAGARVVVGPGEHGGLELSVRKGSP